MAWGEVGMQRECTRVERAERMVGRWWRCVVGRTEVEGEEEGEGASSKTTCPMI